MTPHLRNVLLFAAIAVMLVLLFDHFQAPLTPYA